MRTAQTAGDSLIDRVNRLLERNERNDFILRSIQKEAEALRRVDAFKAYLVFGMIACLERDVNTTKDFHLKALKIRDNYLANFNFATSLVNLGAKSEALPYYKKAIRCEPENIGALEDFLEAAFDALSFRLAGELLAKWKKLNPGKEHPYEKVIDRVVTALNRSGVSDAEAESIESIAESILLRDKVPLVGCVVDLLKEDDSEWVDCEIQVEKGVSSVVEMNCNLAEIVAEKIDPKIMRSIVVRYSAAN